MNNLVMMSLASETELLLLVWTKGLVPVRSKALVQGESKPTNMPPASVMTRLILIMV
jgi:hypothetical protein